MRASRIGIASFLALLLAILTLAGCGTPGLAPVDSRDGSGPVPRGYYRIRPGDSLSVIALRLNIPLKTLAAWNDLSPPYPLYAGRLLRVAKPPAARRGARTIAQPARPSNAAVRRAETGSSAAESGIRWQWPVSGRVVQGFKAGDRTRQGIRIAAAAGTPVRAVAAGTVVYSGSGLKGYGNLIIVKHSARYLSAYGFNRRLIAREGETLRAGQVLAEVGQSASGEHLLHFEIRRDGAAVDPLRYLPTVR